MSDIVAQLNELADKYTVGDELEEDTGVMRNAASDIERLRAALKECSQRLEQCLIDAGDNPARANVDCSRYRDL
jgi:hypothetical protein